MRRRRLLIPLAIAPLLVLAGARLWPNVPLARADAPPGRYTNGSDTGVAWVKDTLTGLVWKKAEEPSSYDWPTAKTVCTGTWRLPTMSELQTLVDDTATTGAAIDGTFFPNTSMKAFWTSTPAAFDATKAWDVSFWTGANHEDVTSALNKVRCVR